MPRTNDPIQDLMDEIRRKTMQDMVDMFVEAQNVQCGCPESRLCNHDREIEAYSTAAGMIEDQMIGEGLKK